MTETRPYFSNFIQCTPISTLPLFPNILSYLSYKKISDHIIDSIQKSLIKLIDLELLTQTLTVKILPCTAVTLN